jgi:hypothetical protein
MFSSFLIGGAGASKIFIEEEDLSESQGIY